MVLQKMQNWNALFYKIPVPYLMYRYLQELYNKKCDLGIAKNWMPLIYQLFLVLQNFSKKNIYRILEK